MYSITDAVFRSGLQNDAPLLHEIIHSTTLLYVVFISQLVHAYVCEYISQNHRIAFFFPPKKMRNGAFTIP